MASPTPEWRRPHTPFSSRRPTSRRPPKRVLLADPQLLFCDALARAIRADPALELVDALSDADDLRRAIADHRPDVIVVDRELLEPARPLPLGSGDAPPRLLVLAARIDATDVYAAVAAGASGYLSKDANGDVLCRAIAAVAQGETLLDSSAQTMVAGEIRLRGRDDRPLLSAREREVLALIATGLSAPQIARELQISPATVKTHLGHLYEKLGVTERAAAVAEAMRRGLLE